MKLVIRSKSFLTKTGQIGAYLFVLSPIATMIFSAFLMFEWSKSASYSNWPIFAILTLVSAVGFLSGYVMFSIGRETVSQTVSGEDAE